MGAVLSSSTMMYSNFERINTTFYKCESALTAVSVNFIIVFHHTNHGNNVSHVPYSHKIQQPPSITRHDSTMLTPTHFSFNSLAAKTYVSTRLGLGEGVRE